MNIALSDRWVNPAGAFGCAYIFTVAEPGSCSGASWQPDVWGRGQQRAHWHSHTRACHQLKVSAQACQSAPDLASLVWHCHCTYMLLKLYVHLARCMLPTRFSAV